MLGEKLIKRQIKIHIEKVLLKYIKNTQELNNACDDISQIAIEIINIIGIKQCIKLLWYAKRINLLKFKNIG